MNALAFFTTWVVMIALLAFVSATSWGKGLVYWLLWIGVVLLLVLNGNELSKLINPEALALNG